MYTERSTPRRGLRSRSLCLARIFAGLILVFLVALGVHNRPVHGQGTRLVNPFGDDLGGANDCTDPDQPCKTIQQAVNQSGPGDLIELAPGAYPENVNVNQSVTIQGDLFTGSTVNGGNTASVFTIVASNTVTLNSLTITGGNAGNSSSNEGGGIQNNGTLTVVQSSIIGNIASGGAEGLGGGIFNAGGGALVVINSTISGNQVFGGSPAGGGIYNNGGTVTLVNTTLDGNNSAGTGGGIDNASGTLNLTNTIIAGSIGGAGDCTNSGTIGTNDHNFVGDGSCSPLLSGDPKLGPLMANGGPTFTQALMAGSTAIDAGDDAVLGDPLDLATDQRGEGFPRKVCAHVDIGAYEFGAASAPTLKCPANISVTTDPGKTTATVSFSATATDPCTGPITPTYKIGSTPITSPFAFPAGVTTVTVSATSSQDVTATCSFKVTVTALNTCIQDDHTGDTLRWNSTTGQYIYTRCKDKFTLSGTGVAKVSGGSATLTDSKSDRKISATFNQGSLTGHATVTLILAPGLTQTITLNQTNPHATCTCPL